MRARWAAAALLVLGAPAAAEDPSPAAGLRIRHDGGMDDARIPCEPLGGSPVVVAVEQHLDGFRVAVAVSEPPGPSLGVAVRWADAGNPRVQEWISYRPQDLRGPEWTGTVRDSGRGTGLSVLGAGAWSLRVALPPAVDSDGVPRPFLLAVAVTGRVPNRVAFAPAAARFADPSAWTLVVPTEPATRLPDSRRPVREYDPAGRKAADDVRLAAWREHLIERVRGGPADGARARLVGPLERASVMRPDLVMLHVVKGDTLRDLGDLDAAQAAYDEALKVGPHFPEARWARERLRAIRWLERKPGDPSDYDAAFAAIAAGAKEAPEGSPAPALADGVLRYRAGEFEEAARRLAPFAATHAFDEEVVEAHRLAEQGRQAWSAELGYRRASERKEPLPRARLTTSRGAVLVELFEDHAPNAVASFVWLAKHGFYDGTRVGGTTPFSAVRLGDPRTRPGASQERSDGPGWATAAEPSPRKGLRGMLATDADTSGAAGSRFLVLTGTTAFEPGRTTVFGRVLEGQDVVERLAAGDALEKVEVVRTRDHEYRPTTLAGEPAPEPK